MLITTHFDYSYCSYNRQNALCFAKQLSLINPCTDLRSMTGGRGDYSYEFARYEQAPSDVQEKEVAARAAKVAENNAED